MNTEELQTELRNQIESLEEAINADKLDEAEEIKSQIAETKAKLAELEEQLKEAEEAEERTEEDTKDTQADEQEAVQEEERNISNKEEKRNMTNNEQLIEEVVLDNKEEIRSAYQEFLVTGEKRDVVTTDEGVLVPEEVATSIEDLMDDLEGLDKLVDVKFVNSAIGKYPVRNADSTVAPLPTVDELEESPELGLRKLGDFKYEIKTHRGLVKASFEAIDDAVEVEKIINEEMAEAIVATKNKVILDALATLPAQDVSDLDAIKSIVNTGVAKRYAKQIVVSTDVFDALDRMKDSNGQYLLQPSVTSASGTKLFGKDLVVVDADVIGEGVMYIGSLKDAAILFLRKELYVNYEIWNQYGKVFTPIVRLDAGVKNPNAVVKVNFTVTPEA